MVFQFIFLEMYFVNFSVNIVRYAHCNYELFQEERKILLEKCMTVLQQYLSGIQKARYERMGKTGQSVSCCQSTTYDGYCLS